MALVKFGLPTAEGVAPAAYDVPLVDDEAVSIAPRQEENIPVQARATNAAPHPTVRITHRDHLGVALTTPQMQWVVDQIEDSHEEFEHAGDLTFIYTRINQQEGYIEIGLGDHATGRGLKPSF